MHPASVVPPPPGASKKKGGSHAALGCRADASAWERCKKRKSPTPACPGCLDGTEEPTVPRQSSGFCAPCRSSLRSPASPRGSLRRSVFTAQGSRPRPRPSGPGAAHGPPQPRSAARAAALRPPGLTATCTSRPASRWLPRPTGTATPRRRLLGQWARCTGAPPCRRGAWPPGARKWRMLPSRHQTHS